MITHGVVEFMDDLRRTWCGIDLAPGDPRPADGAIVDCMSCLVQKTRGERPVVIGREITMNDDGTMTVGPLMGSIRQWR